MNCLHQFIWEELEAQYGEPHCPKCGNEAVSGDSDIDQEALKELIGEAIEEGKRQLSEDELKELDRHDWDYKNERHACGDYACDSCRLLFDGEDAFGENPNSYTLDTEEYKCEVGNENSDLWVFKSSYYTKAQYCSPCAPGAGRLENPCDAGPKTYCLGEDFFDDESPCPYPIWCVDNDELVYTPKPEEIENDSQDA